MSAENDYLAAVLEEHQWSVSRGTCWCGWEPANAIEARLSREGQFACHQADEIRSTLGAALPDQQQRVWESGVLRAMLSDPPKHPEALRYTPDWMGATARAMIANRDAALRPD